MKINREKLIAALSEGIALLKEKDIYSGSSISNDMLYRIPGEFNNPDTIVEQYVDGVCVNWMNNAWVLRRIAYFLDWTPGTPIECPYNGICYTFFDTRMLGLLETLFVTWPKFSGSTVHPIPSGCDMSPCNMYAIWNINRQNMFDGNTTYGRLRLEAIEHLQKKISEFFEKDVDTGSA